MGRIWYVDNLMTVDEYKTLNVLPPSMRPAWVQVQLNMSCQFLSRHLEEPGFYIQVFSRNAEDVMNLFKSAYRIVEVPVPMPYRHILYVLVFGFVYITPWIYVNNGKFWLWFAGWASSSLVGGILLFFSSVIVLYFLLNYHSLLWLYCAAVQ